MHQRQTETFHFVGIKPSHYDDNGYPYRWLRSAIPANTLAVINGLVEDCARRQVLGPNVDIRIHLLDESNQRVRPDKIIRDIRRTGGKALIGFVGAQTNQFPRTVDLAIPFLEAGLPVAIGGFHVSGCLAMLPELPPDIRKAQEMGIALFAGEAEDGRLDEVLRDAWAGQLKPLYNHMDDLPALEGQPLPFLDRSMLQRNLARYSSFDLGRGCPYQCTFCTIINVQGRKSRFRTPDDLERIIRANLAQGIYKFFVTDDDLARNKAWESLFDRLIKLRKEEGLVFYLTIQVDTQCHKIPGFIEKACKAGVRRAFMGLENINPDNLIAVGKRQNKITEYRAMMQEWRKYGTILFAGYIIGFPNDTKESVLRDIEIIKRELPLDVLEIVIMQPLPGSADHKRLYDDGVWMDPDMNKYDLCHRVTHHPTMSDAEWVETYRAAWDAYYTMDHIETVGRRAAARRPYGINVNELFEFYLTYKIDDVHPLEGGVLRLKARHDRRRGMPVESALTFYPRFWAETVVKTLRYAWGFYQSHRMHKRIHADPNRHAYTDLATTPAAPEEVETLSLFTETSGGQAAVRRSEVLKGHPARTTKPKAPPVLN